MVDISPSADKTARQIQMSVLSAEGSAPQSQSLFLWVEHSGRLAAVLSLKAKAWGLVGQEACLRAEASGPRR